MTGVGANSTSWRRPSSVGVVRTTFMLDSATRSVGTLRLICELPNPPKV